MANALARSVKHHSPSTKVALVTDSVSLKRDPAVDVVMPLQPDFGSGLRQKLSIDHYSPFHRTIFVDADCLAVQDVRFMWELFAGTPLGVCGRSVFSGRWCGGDLQRVRTKLGIVRPLPKFNSGLIYWEDISLARDVFAQARKLLPRYRELGFSGLRPDLPVNDEPLLGFAMALYGIDLVNDRGRTMRTMVGMRGRLQIDVLRGVCRLEKEGEVVEPAIFHFSGDIAANYYYRRERRKLRLVDTYNLPATMVAPLVNAVYWPLALWYRARKISEIVATSVTSALRGRRRGSSGGGGR